MSPTRVVIIGIDAATLELARPWMAGGHLPNLTRVAECGAVGPLRSTLPPMSPAAWSTFATGVNPGKHGILDFCQLAPDSYEPRLPNASQRRGVTFWEVAARRGIRSGILNVPFTYPPRASNGFLISGMLTPGLHRRMAAPQEVFDDLMEFSPDYAIDVEVLKRTGRNSKALFLEKALQLVDTRRDAAIGLYRRHRPALFCVVFVAVDRICHRYWSDHETARAGRAGTEPDGRFGRAILAAYRKVDSAVGALLEEAGDDTDVFIMSDHGAGPVHKELNMRRLLVAADLLVEVSAGRVRRLVESSIRRFTRSAPRVLKNRIKSFLPHLARRAGGLELCGGIDFSRTRAYPAGHAGGVFVNLRGRQPDGIVEPGQDYEDVRDRIIAALLELKDPKTERSIVRAAHRREDVWSGPHVPHMPDVILELADESCDISSRRARAPGVITDIAPPGPGRWPRVGRHKRDGLLMAMGPHVAHAEVRGAGIADVPATVLNLLGCDVPEQFDGRVLSEMLTGDVAPVGQSAATHDEARPGEPDLSEAEKAAVEERLKGLGYL